MQQQNPHLLPIITRYHNILLRYARLHLKQEDISSMVVARVWEHLYLGNKLCPGHHLRREILNQLREEISEAKKAINLTTT